MSKAMDEIEEIKALLSMIMKKVERFEVVALPTHGNNVEWLVRHAECGAAGGRDE